MRVERKKKEKKRRESKEKWHNDISSHTFSGKEAISNGPASFRMVLKITKSSNIVPPVVPKRAGTFPPVV